MSTNIGAVSARNADDLRSTALRAGTHLPPRTESSNPPSSSGESCANLIPRPPGPRRPLPLNHLPGENRGTAGRIGEVGLATAVFGSASTTPDKDPARDWSYHVDSTPIASVLVRVPIGTDRDPPVQRILDLESKWKPALERGPGSVLIHTFANMSGDPAAFDRHGASTTPPDGYFYTSPGLMRS